MADKLAFRASVLYQRRDDYVDNTFAGPSADGTATPKKNAMGGFEERHARLQLLFTPNEQLTVLSSAHLRSYDGTATLFLRSALTKGSNKSDAPRDRVAFDEADNNPQSYDGQGVSLNVAYDFGPVSLSQDEVFVLIVGWALVALAVLLSWLLVRSPWGRVLKGIREDEDAVRSLGKNVYMYKMQALVIGGVLGCLGGFIYALGQRAVQPDFFGTDSTFFVYAILILGGAARVFGPVLGTVIFWALIQGSDVILRSGIDAGYPGFSLMTGSQAAVIRFILVGAGLMALMIFRPQGILGDRKVLALDAR